MHDTYFEARELSDPKHPKTSEWKWVLDDEMDGSPIRGNTAEAVRKQLRELEIDTSNVIIAHVEVTYIKV